MKRIKSACLHLTLKFDCAEAFAAYREGLARKQTPYKILGEEKQADGTLLVKLVRSYNTYDCAHYLEREGE